MHGDRRIKTPVRLLIPLRTALCGRRGDLIASTFVSGSIGPKSRPGRGHCVVFLGKTLNSLGASLHPGV